MLRVSLWWIPLKCKQLYIKFKNIEIQWTARVAVSYLSITDLIFRYGKTKDSFGWPEEPEDIPAGQSNPAQVTAGTAATGTDTENPTVSPTPLTSVDK